MLLTLIHSRLNSRLGSTVSFGAGLRKGVEPSSWPELLPPRPPSAVSRLLCEVPKALQSCIL